MLPCGTDKQTREDNATQPLDAGRLSFAIIYKETVWVRCRTIYAEQTDM